MSFQEFPKLAVFAFYLMSVVTVAGYESDERKEERNKNKTKQDTILKKKINHQTYGYIFKTSVEIMLPSLSTHATTEVNLCLGNIPTLIDLLPSSFL